MVIQSLLIKIKIPSLYISVGFVATDDNLRSSDSMWDVDSKEHITSISEGPRTRVMVIQSLLIKIKIPSLYISVGFVATTII